MSDASIHTPAQTKEASFGDFFALLKPRVMSLVVFTAMVGLLAAPGSFTRSSLSSRSFASPLGAGPLVR